MNPEVALPASPDMDAVAPALSTEPLRVMLVEDDPVSLKILQKRIKSGGYEVCSARNGKEGLALYEAFDPDLIISDWMMPEMDGRELCAEIRSRPGGHRKCFMLLTARDKNEDIVQALDTGADEYLVKPCNGPELMARVRAAERILRLQDALRQSNDELHVANDRINKELADISEIQRSLLPQELPRVEGYGFSAFYRPSTECSGDFYDLLPQSDGRISIIMGDVSGHGAAAMVAMALIRTLTRSISPRIPKPAALLCELNNLMFEYLPTAQYATMFYGMLDPAKGELEYSSAGHPPPVLHDLAGGKATYLPDCEGFPIKLIGPGMPYENHRARIPAGHRMICYTDGLLEAFDGEMDMYGSERLLRTVAASGPDCSPEELQQRILDDLSDHVQGRPLDDDLSLLVVARD